MRNFINSLERIPQTIEQYKEKNAALAKDIPLLKEIADKQWKKEDELKGLKSELAALERKIQLELSKDNEPKQEEQQAVANSDVTTDMNYRHLYLKLMYHCITYINQRIYARISQYASNKLCTFVYLFSWSNRLFVCF